MKLFLQYLKEKKQIFGIAVPAILLVFVLTYLYDVPVELPLYFTVLLLFTVAALMAFGWKRYRDRIAELKRIYEMDRVILPERTLFISQTELYCYEILCKLETARCELENTSNQQISDRLEYYTMWVHQIKTPISSLSVLLQVNRNNMDAGLNKDMEMELFLIEQYVDMALNYAKLCDCSNDLVITKCSLDDMIRKTIQKYRKIFIGKKIAVEYEKIGFRIVTDEKWFCFVLGQLLSNSLKYTGKGKIAIYMQDGNLVISDTGIGIAAEDLPRIFEKGYTGYNGRLDKKASGIGLYLCRKVLNLLGDTIRAESEPGEGTRMIIGFDRSELVIE